MPYYFAGLRAAHGYEPGDDVSEEFAAAYPGLVTAVAAVWPDAEAAAAPADEEEECET